jgi:hypothetical protein
VFGSARVSDNAWVSDSAWVFGNARVCGSAWVSENAQVLGDAYVYGNARVSDNAQVLGDAQVSGDAQVLSWQHLFPLANTPWGPLILVRQRDGSGVLQCGCQMFGLDDDPVQVAVRALDTVDQEVRLPDLLVALVPQLRSTARVVVDSW